MRLIKLLPGDVVLVLLLAGFDFGELCLHQHDFLQEFGFLPLGTAILFLLRAVDGVQAQLGISRPPVAQLVSQGVSPAFEIPPGRIDDLFGVVKRSGFIFAKQGPPAWAAGRSGSWAVHLLFHPRGQYGTSEAACPYRFQRYLNEVRVARVCQITERIHALPLHLIHNPESRRLLI